MAKIIRESLSSEKVDRNGIAGEGIQYEQIKLLRGFGFQREARIARDDFHASLACFEKCEVAFGQPTDLGVDFVEAECVAGPSIDRKRARAQADDSDSAIGLPGKIVKSEA